MLAQRVAQQSLRRLALSSSKSPIASQMMFRKALTPLASSSLVQMRPATTQILTPKESTEILAAQRKKRPTSPHLTIYSWQITMVMSISTRITGALLSGGFYILGVTYLASPLLGWHMDSASLAAAFATWPVMAKVFTKFLFAFPFTFHSFNGVRHLVWDTGSQFTNKQVIKTGLFVTATSVLAALGLSIFV